MGALRHKGALRPNPNKEDKLQLLNPCLFNAETSQGRKRGELKEEEPLRYHITPGQPGFRHLAHFNDRGFKVLH